MSSNYIFGKHAVRALLEQEPKRVLNLYLASNVDGEFRSLASARYQGRAIAGEDAR